MFLKNINVDVFDDVLQNANHRANDASNDVNRPPLDPSHPTTALFGTQTLSHLRAFATNQVLMQICAFLGLFYPEFYSFIEYFIQTQISAQKIGG